MATRVNGLDWIREGINKYKARRSTLTKTLQSREREVGTSKIPAKSLRLQIQLQEDEKSIS